jgi:protein TonB
MTLSEFVPPTPKEKVEEPKEIPKKEEIKEVVPPEPLKPLPRTEPKPKPEPKKVVKKPYKKPASIKRVQQSSGHFNLLMSKVRNKIDKNKSYPRIAKRRGLQGKVTVTFTILPNGNVSNIQLKGPTLFYRSAREAIRKAFPIKLNKFKVKLPKEVTIVLNYRLH